VRSEIDIRTGKSFALGDGILTLRGRVGWAHDDDPDLDRGSLSVVAWRGQRHQCPVNDKDQIGSLCQQHFPNCPLVLRPSGNAEARRERETERG
jgi:hypothetical protein